MGFSRFFLSDLHVHTPADKNHQYGQVGGKEPSAAFATTLMEKHSKAGVEVVGVTDHNRLDWYPFLRDAGLLAGVTVFPGLEFSVNGCHLIGLWDCTDDGYVRAAHFLTKLFEPGASPFASNGDPKPVTRMQVAEWIDAILDSGGLAFAPHATNKSMGLFGQGVCRNSTDIAQSGAITAFDVAGSTSADVLTNPRRQFGDIPPRWFITGDTRSLEKVGSRATWLKLGSAPTLEGIRQAFLSPETRVRIPESLRAEWGHVLGLRFAETVKPHWPRLERLTVKGGFHADLDVRFGPGLNAIIGGKGTGKSALIEILRHISDQTPTKAQDLQENLKRNLPANSQASLDFVDSIGHAYAAERSGDRTKPRLLRNGKEVPGLDVAKRLSLQIFGQRELQALVDRPGNMRDFVAISVGEDWTAKRQVEAVLAQKCRGTAERIERLSTQVEAIESLEGEIADLKEKLDRWTERGVGAIFQRLQVLARANQRVTTRFAWPGALGKSIDNLKQLLPPPPAPEHDKVPIALAATVDELAAAIEEHSAVLLDVITTSQQSMESQRAEWEATYEAERLEIAGLLADAGIDDPAQVDSSQARLAEVEEQVQRSADVRAELTTAVSERRLQLQGLLDARREMSRLIDAAARELTSRVSRRVRVRVDPLADTSGLGRIFDRALAGQGARSAAVARLLEHPPLAIVQAMSTSATAVEALGCVGSTAEKIARLPLRIRHEIEEVALTDSISVEVNVAGDKAEDWRPISKVSPGQRATAMLALALASSNDPLIIDQPEDDLDNRYIFDEVVKVLASVCDHRQVIVATHNANIPILGDAELVLALDATSERSSILACGGLEEQAVADAARRILEGGDEAFRARQYRYLAADSPHHG